MSLALDERRLAMLAEMGLRDLAAWSAAGRLRAVPAAANPPPAAASSQPCQDEPQVRSLPPVAAVPPAIRVPQETTSGQTSAARSGTVVAEMEWDGLAQAVAACRACRLCDSRRNTVFGVGDTQAEWLVVGEAPGEHEDRQGEPFVGQAGKLLDNMLGALGLDRHHKVYIANVLKCRPPGNRNPEPDEVAQCEPFLRRQVELLRPRIILAMGRFAVQSLLGTTEPIGRLRGRLHQYLGVPVVVTYHPAYLLRNLPEKGKAWADLCLAQEALRSQAA